MFKKITTAPLKKTLFQKRHYTTEIIKETSKETTSEKISNYASSIAFVTASIYLVLVTYWSKQSAIIEGTLHSKKMENQALKREILIKELEVVKLMGK